MLANGKVQHLRLMAQPLYSPLDTAKAEFRLLRIQFTSDDISPIVCETKTFNLATCPKYHTLSYVWGSPTNTEVITLNDQSFQATRNLVCFLREVLSRMYQLCWMHAVAGTALPPLEPAMGSNGNYWFGWLWVDALCIDQANLVERNQQVQMMGRIYRQAAYSMAWLGEDYLDAGNALMEMNTLGAWVTNHVNDFSWSKLDPKFYQKDWPLFPFNRFWTSIISLMRRPFWYRVWICQELVLPKLTLIFCGSVSCPLSYVVATVQIAALRSTQLEQPDVMDASVWQGVRMIGNIFWSKVYRSEQIRTQLRNLEKQIPAPDSSTVISEYWGMIAYARNLEATDPRDTIYGFLGMLNIPIKPDYSRAVNQLFHDFAKLGIEHGRLTDVLRLSGQRKYDSTALLTTSWVPQLHMPIWSEVFLNQNYARFAADRSLETCNQLSRHSIDGKGSLTLSGISVGTVIHTTTIKNAADVDFFDPLVHFTSSVDGTSNYLDSKISSLGACLRCITCNCPRNSAENVDEYFGEASELLCILASSVGYPDIKDEAVLQKRLSQLSIPFNYLFNDKISGSILGLQQYDANPFAAMSPLEAFRRAVQSRSVEVYRSMTSFIGGASLFKLDSGYIGIMPGRVDQHDIVVVAPGCHIPIVLRPLSNGYLHLGVSFVLGLMYGNVDFSGHKFKQFSIY